LHIIIVLIILNQNNSHISSLMTRAGQPVTHMRSTNSKPQAFNHSINSPQTQSSPAYICSCSHGDAFRI